MIEEIHQATGHSIRAICTTLKLPHSSYYHAQNPTTTQQQDQDLTNEIKTVFHTHRRRYGYRRIHAQLRDEAIQCAPC